MSTKGKLSIGELEEYGAFIQIQDGNHGEKHPKATDYVERGIPFIMANDLGGGFLNLDACSMIRPEQAEKLRIGFAKTGDVLLTHKGTIGNVAILDHVEPYAMLTPQVTYYRVNENILSREYLAYAFRDPVFQKEMKSLAQQSTRPYIGITAQRRLRVNWRNKDQQKSIVGLIKPYDDLIKNNRRRIELLEKAARLLYREWFVNFRFPGHETKEFLDGFPEGWTRIQLDKITTKIGSGATPKGGAEAYQPVGTTLIRSLNVYNFKFSDDGLVFLSEEQENKLSNVAVKENDVLINITGASVGRCCMVPKRHLPARVNQHVMIIRADQDKCNAYYILHSLNAHQNKEALLSIARAGGATREALTKDTMIGYEITLPAEELIYEFGKIVGGMQDQIETLASLNQRLAKARDLLLPRLMEGRIEV